MKLLSILLLSVVSLSFFLSGKTEVSAKNSESFAKCRMPTFTEAYREANTIFAGKVLSVRKEGDERIFTLQVEKYWKGTKSKTLEVRYYETWNFQAWLQVGGRYLVYARKDEKGNLVDGRCSMTKNYSEASVELKKLGKAKLVK